MATYNGANYVEASVRSILAQTLRDLELVVVNDGSTDSTSAILGRLAKEDTRLKVHHSPGNMGVVAARNTAFAAAQGRYVASLDHDDLARPTRLAKQVDALNDRPDAVLCCSDARQLRPDGVGPRIFPGTFDHGRLHWRLHLANPIVQSTIMFRRNAVELLDAFMRPGFEYADDFDFYHRITHLGKIVHIPEPLTFYRIHAHNAATRYNATMATNARRVLANAYAPLVGDQAPAVAATVADFVAQKRAPRDRDEIERLERALTGLVEGYASTYGLDGAAYDRIAADARNAYEAAVCKAAAAGLPHLARLRPVTTTLRESGAASGARRARVRAAAVGSTPVRLRAALKRIWPRAAGSAPESAGRTLHGTRLTPWAARRDMPPTLAVVVDTEAEFDWRAPFDRGQTAVTNVQEQWRAQQIYDRYGLRPLYLIDYPVATSAESCATLRALVEGNRCSIGAHLQPWTTPPFSETVSVHNSFAGNLPENVERAKLRTLVTAIRNGLGVDPVHFKAGRYGLGPNTFRILQETGFRVDFSVMPGADYSRDGGPNFAGLAPIPYRLGDGLENLIEIPMTREHTGQRAGTDPGVERFLRHGAVERSGIPGFLARVRLINRVPLTPEGVTASEAIALVDSMLDRGYRSFVLHYHSSSLLPGYTPYTPTAAERDALVDRIDAIVDHLMNRVGAVPGLPVSADARRPATEPAEAVHP